MVIGISAQFLREELSSGFRGNMRFGRNRREYGVKVKNCENIKVLALTTRGSIRWRNHARRALVTRTLGRCADVQWMVLTSQKLAMDLQWWAAERYTLEWEKSEQWNQIKGSLSFLCVLVCFPCCHDNKQHGQRQPWKESVLFSL